MSRADIIPMRPPLKPSPAPEAPAGLPIPAPSPESGHPKDADSAEVTRKGLTGFYGSCVGPTGPCLLGIGHPGAHVRPHATLTQREEMRALLGVAGKLLRGIQSYGNPGHSFRQDLCDRIEKLLRETR